MPTPVDDQAQLFGKIVDLAIPFIGALFVIFIPRRKFIDKFGPVKGPKLVTAARLCGGLLLLITLVRVIVELS